MMTVATLAPKLTAKGAGSVGVIASSATGWDIAGQVGAVVAALVAVVGIALAINRNNHARTREYQAEIRGAYLRGQESVREQTADLRATLADERSESDYWRGYAMSMLSAGGTTVVPPPPPRRQRRPALVPDPPPADDETGES